MVFVTNLTSGVRGCDQRPSMHQHTSIPNSPPPPPYHHHEPHESLPLDTFSTSTSLLLHPWPPSDASQRTPPSAGRVALGCSHEASQPHVTPRQPGAGGDLSFTAGAPSYPPSASVSLADSSWEAWGGQQDGLAQLEWRLIEAAHAREVESLITALQSAGDDAALHATLLSRLRLCELTFATRRRRTVVDTAHAMQRNAHRRTLRAFIEQWRRATECGRRRERVAEEWSASMAEAGQRAALRCSVGHWLRRVHESRACALLRLRRERRLQRVLLSQWRAALDLCQAQQHLALLVERRRRRRLLHPLLACWQQHTTAAARHRLLASLQLQWESDRRRRQQRWLLVRWSRWCARQAECRRRVAMVMRASAQCERGRVRPGLWQLSGAETPSAMHASDPTAARM